MNTVSQSSRRLRPDAVPEGLAPGAGVVLPSPTGGGREGGRRPAGLLGSHPALGFSLVELLVVIAIIVLLVGIGVVVQRSARDSALMGQSRLVLQQALGVLSEYRTQIGSVPTETNGNIVTFVQAVKGNPTCLQMLNNMGADVYDKTNDKIKDAWLNDIKYFSSYNGSDYRQSNMPYFLSAGPDGKLGKLGGTATEKTQANDNIYSLDIK